MIKTPEIERAERSVLRLLSRTHRAYQPVDIARKLSVENVTSLAVRHAIWRLADRREVEITPDLEVKITKSAVAQAR